MATLAAAEQGMERFVQGLFQGNPDLSTLTHAIVRRKYLTHIGKETLTKEEKKRFKQLIMKELVQIQIEDSGDEELLTRLNPPAKPGGRKRTLCISDSSGDEAESKHERKKQRTVKELELSSNEEDSGIDSKKAQVGCGPKHAGKSSSSSDHGDSGAEGPSDALESEEESMKNNNAPPSQRIVRDVPGSPSSKGQRGRGKGERSGSEGEESEGGQESDIGEEAHNPRKATKHPAEESESNSEDDLEEVKVQRKKGLGRAKKGPDRVEKGECRKEAKQRGKREIESDDENDLSETHRKKRDRSDSEKVRAGGVGRKGKTTGRKAQERSQSMDESDCASKEKQKKPRKATGYKHDNKDVSVEELESDSDDTEDKGQKKKDVRKTKSPRASAEKWKTDSDSEEREVPKKKVKSQGVTKAQGWGANQKELGGNQKRRSPVKQQGGHKPKRSMSRQEENGSKPKKKGTWDSSGSENESQSEAEQRGKGGKQSEEMAASGDGSESGSEETTGAARGPKRASGERKGNEWPSGSEHSEEEEETPPKKKGAEKSQRGSVRKTDLESDSEDLGSGSPAGKGKNRSQEEKRTQKPKGKGNSKEEVRCESDEEEERSSSGDEASPRFSKKSHKGKDKEHHSAKDEDHPSVRRLKRYIRECGAHRNYKKLLMGCRSRKAQLEVLKQELENLGLKGTPSLAKCKALKKKREEAAEVASLDLSNIIATEGRPRRHNFWSVYSKPEKLSRGVAHPLSSPEGSPIRRPTTDWSRLRGVISSDDESD